MLGQGAGGELRDDRIVRWLITSTVLLMLLGT